MAIFNSYVKLPEGTVPKKGHVRSDVSWYVLYTSLKERPAHAEEGPRLRASSDILGMFHKDHDPELSKASLRTSQIELELYLPLQTKKWSYKNWKIRVSVKAGHND